jgi:peptidoglycan/xylan/chitin deacetylase (PgdA/CDA1 family)
MEQVPTVNDKKELLIREKRWEKYYLVKTPLLIKKMYPSYLWSMGTKEKILYLTFDDGPHPEITPFVLRQLKRYDALATFFCIGKNVAAYPDVYKQIQDEGHTVGNHTYNHLNGWKTENEIYLKDIAEASKLIDSSLFRPSYGRITSFQAKNLRPVMKGKDPRIVMWDVLSGDFDTNCTPQQCLASVVFASVSGSIIVFHDSEKAFPRLEYTLPRILNYFSEKGYLFKPLE